MVDRTVAEFLGCGRLERGFVRLRCPGCEEERVLAFSCKTRGLCASCGAKRTAAWAAWFTGTLAREVPHRHVVVTLPRARSDRVQATSPAPRAPRIAPPRALERAPPHLLRPV